MRMIEELHALQRPPPVRSSRRGLSGIECSPVQRVQLLGGQVPGQTARPGSGAACDVQPARVRWGLGLHLWGIWGEPGGGVVDASRRKNSKKAFFLPTHPLFSAQNTPPPLPISKISRKNKKTPTKGLCSVLYLPYKP